MSDSDSDFDSMPETFSGQRSKLGPFLAELDRTFAHQPGTFGSDRAKVIFATALLKGTALKWAMSHPESTESYTTFREDICGRFGNPDEKATALHQVKKLRQHGSARSYHARFVRYAEKCDWKDPTDKIKAFYKGLKDDVKDSLATADWTWKTDFDKFSNMVFAVDEKLHPPVLKEQVNKYGDDAKA